EHVEAAVAVVVEIDDVGEAGAVGLRRLAGQESPDGGLAGGEREAGELADVVGAIGVARDRGGDGVGGAALGARREHGERGDDLSVGVHREQAVGGGVGHDALAGVGEEAVGVALDRAAVGVGLGLVVGHVDGVG